MRPWFIVVAAPIAIAPSALAVGGCVGVLGLDDYGAVEDQLCVCDALDGLGPQRCRERVESALSEDSAAAEGWLAHFDEQGCGSSCEAALSCFDQPPVCTPVGDACQVSAECCGSSGTNSEVGCCSDPVGAGTCCASCASCGDAAESESAIAVCADDNDNTIPLAECVCSFATSGLCADSCGPACDEPIKLSKPCFDCLNDDPSKPCGLQISLCRESQP